MKRLFWCVSLKIGHRASHFRFPSCVSSSAAERETHDRSSETSTDRSLDLIALCLKSASCQPENREKGLVRASLVPLQLWLRKRSFELEQRSLPTCLSSLLQANQPQCLALPLFLVLPTRAGAHIWRTHLAHTFLMLKSTRNGICRVPSAGSTSPELIQLDQLWPFTTHSCSFRLALQGIDNRLPDGHLERPKCHPKKLHSQSAFESVIFLAF